MDEEVRIDRFAIAFAAAQMYVKQAIEMPWAAKSSLEGARDQLALAFHMCPESVRQRIDQNRSKQ